MLVAAHANHYLRGDGSLRFCSARVRPVTLPGRRPLRWQSAHLISSGQPGTWI